MTPGVGELCGRLFTGVSSLPELRATECVTFQPILHTPESPVETDGHFAAFDDGVGAETRSRSPGQGAADSSTGCAEYPSVRSACFEQAQGIDERKQEPEWRAHRAARTGTARRLSTARRADRDRRRPICCDRRRRATGPTEWPGLRQRRAGRRDRADHTVGMVATGAGIAPITRRPTHFLANVTAPAAARAARAVRRGRMLRRKASDPQPDQRAQWSVRSALRFGGATIRWNPRWPAHAVRVPSP